MTFQMAEASSIVDKTNPVEDFVHPRGGVFTDDLSVSVFEPLSWRFLRFKSWLADKKRQVFTLAGDEILKQAVLFPPRFPVEGSRFQIGECIFEYQPTGKTRRYKICGIQTGGLSNVYTVVDLDEMKPYCLKENRVLPGDEHIRNERLRFEAEMLLRLGNHPHLVKVESVFYHRRQICIVYEYVSGRSLDYRLKKKALDAPTALRFAIDICRAVNYARQTIPGFVHGDIKPGNCLIAGDGRLKLADFGLSADRLNYETSRPAEVKAGKHRRYGGTYAYMAPELFGSEPVDRGFSDIYAFGVTLFEMFAGKRPFKSRLTAELIEKHKFSDPPLELLEKKGISPRLIKLIASCMAKKADERPVSFISLENSLREICREEFHFDSPEIEMPESVSDNFARRAGLMLVLGNAKAAAGYYARSARLPGGGNEKRAAEALVCLLRNDIDGAIKISRKAVSCQPGDFTALFIYARILLTLKKFPAAETYLKRALRLEPLNVQALNLTGDLCLKQKRFSDAKKYFKRAKTLDGTQTASLEGLCRVYLITGRSAKARKIALEGIDIDPQNGYFRQIIGDFYLNQRQYAKALDEYKKALSVKSPSRSLRKSFLAAACALSELLKKPADDQLIKLLSEGAHCFCPSDLGENRARRFIEDFIEALAESAFDPLMVYLLDDAVNSAIKSAESSVKKTLSGYLGKVRENSSAANLPFDIHYSTGKIFYHLRQFEECEKALFESLRQKRASEKAFYYLGACREAAGDYKASLSFYQKALRQNGNCELNRSGVGRMEAKIKEIKAGNNSSPLVPDKSSQLILS